MGDTLPLPALGPDGRPLVDDAGRGARGETNPEREALLQLMAAIGVEPRTAVLVAGCGDGALPLGAAELVGPRGRVLGVDRNPGAVEATRRRATERTLGQLELRAIDPARLETPERFDSVLVASSSLPLWPETLLASLASLVRPHGLFAVVDLGAFGAEAAGSTAAIATEAASESSAAFAPVPVAPGAGTAAAAAPAALDAALPWALGRAGLPRPRVALRDPGDGTPPSVVAAWCRLEPATP